MGAWTSAGWAKGTTRTTEEPSRTARIVQERVSGGPQGFHGVSWNRLEISCKGFVNPSGFKSDLDGPKGRKPLIFAILIM